MSRGDHLIVGRGLYTHHGIDLGDGTVVHYSGWHSGLKAGPVERVPYDVFCEGREPRIRRHPKATHSPEEAADRALERVGEDRYNVVWRNCESLCRWAHTGGEWSVQIGACTAVALATGVALGGVLMKTKALKPLLGPGALGLGLLCMTPRIASQL
jgi:hypothetical protein